MPSSGMLHRVVLVRTEVSEEHNASIIRVTRFGELGAALAPTDASCEEVLTDVVLSSTILVTLMLMEAHLSSETSVLTRATRCNIPEDGILYFIIVIVPNLKSVSNGTPRN
jgi:hypothetical protein